MCKVDESKNCERVLIFRDQYGAQIRLPINDREDYIGKDDITPIIESLGFDPATVSDPTVIIEREKDTIYISEHAMKRLRKRLGFNKSAAYRMTKKAFEKGITKDNANGYLKTWIESKVTRQGNGSDFRIYGQYAFIFDKNVLVTVYNMVQKEAYKVAHEQHVDKAYNRTRENAKVRKAIRAMSVCE
ncbi:MAG: hypothetical protein ACI4CS_04845 [Candidatus Weimeria sp.]